MTFLAARKPWHFSHSIGVCYAAFLLAFASFSVYVWTESRIDEANAARYASHALVEELRQSSDDLTRMVRSYAVTGAPLYRHNYLEILAIRNGASPRPLSYGNVYWDLVFERGVRPRPSGAPVALLELMRLAGFTAPELAALTLAKDHSDRLSETERVAMALLDAGGADRAAAIAMLHDAAYHRAKAGIMLPIATVNASVERRTLRALEEATVAANLARTAFILAGAALLWLLWRTKRHLDRILGCSVDQLHDGIERLGAGDLGAPIPVPAGQGCSVAARLADMRDKLLRLELERGQALERSLRLGRLYAALSQCNQAIVRSADEAELFAGICHAVVQFGGMTMTWIGMLDADGRRVRPVASFGSGVDYLRDLRVSTDADEAEGRGPVGTAFRSGEPYWCQDFRQDPATAAWHARAAQFGWAASAAIPLRRGGRVVGFFSPYSDRVGAFDAEARELLLEMALDIEFALKNFDRDAERERAEQSLRRSERHLRTIIETEPECIKVMDGNGRLLEMNAAGLAILEADTLEQLQQHSLIDLVAPEFRAAFMALHQRVMGGENGRLEFKVRGLKGGTRWLETHAAPMRGENGETTMLLGITRDVSERKLSDERIQYLAHFDALTGLPNRARIEEMARYALAQAHRNGESLALMMLDLDHFKDINDSLGHSVGDALLLELGKRLRLTLRENDMVARLGGDEFIFVLPQADAGGAARVARKLLEAIDAPYRIGPYDLKVTASIGIALYPGDGEDMETLLKCADAAMYQVKQADRHDFRFFTAEMQRRSARNLQLVSALRYAVERRQLQVVYQPQVALPDRRVVGAEALLRWSTPELGVVSPAEFIPAAEDSGLILEIGAWVLRQAVRQARLWMDAGMAPLVMAVNLSAVQFRNTALPELITRILSEEGLPAEYLELELTEGVAMHDPQGAIAMMNNLHERGVRMSIDDFGTGFSSLSHLKKFKIYKLKIDQSFVRDISTDAEDKAIVGAIIHMARSLGLKTIAEGVETAEQLAFLSEQSCDEMQGYFFSKPLAPAQFEQLLRDRAAP
ncbi:putative bifunctional diguanylate cyclase/phosphodiesterase [Janthinobacterium sp.]|uniref:putative bifunctional diguanylate cyclase/phosphodiesterase n=1 Tax=Janthinobacterium sp. TaxID=1871054 RepID=UPI00293D7624|nr:EAL domain-containing protein [Janthinobacterium sp.]